MNSYKVTCFEYGIVKSKVIEGPDIGQVMQEINCGMHNDVIVNTIVKIELVLDVKAT